MSNINNYPIPQGISELESLRALLDFFIRTYGIPPAGGNPTDWNTLLQEIENNTNTANIFLGQVAQNTLGYIIQCNQVWCDNETISATASIVKNTNLSRGESYLQIVSSADPVLMDIKAENNIGNLIGIMVQDMTTGTILSSLGLTPAVSTIYKIIGKYNAVQITNNGISDLVVQGQNMQ